MTVCARIVRIGIVPQTGARLQYITVLGADSTSFSWGNRGLARNLGTGICEWLIILLGVLVPLGTTIVTGDEEPERLIEPDVEAS